MTWTTFFLIWLVSGFFNGIYTVRKDWYHHNIFESTSAYKVFETLGIMALCTVAGLIGVAVSIWERWFDPSNI